MANKRNIWVSPTRDGRWKVQREGGQRATLITDRKADAERAAREVGRRDQVEVIIQGRHGQIQQRESYGNDPMPPRDKEH